MESTILLKEKWRVQKELAKSVNYDLAKYALLIDSVVDEVTKNFKKARKREKTNSEK